MAARETVQALMAGIGPVLDPLGVVAFEDENVWGLLIDEETPVLIDFDEPQGKLVLSVEIGAPRAGDRSALYELLLRHNYHWDETGGVRMALDGAGGNVVQLFDLPLADLDVTRLYTVVSNFVAMAQAWRVLVGQPPGPGGGRVSFDPTFEGMIRA